MGTKKLKLVISDFHLSRGKWLKNGKRNPLEDFFQDERFRELLEFYSSGMYDDYECELIVNGDFFDPLAVLPIPEANEKPVAHEYPLEVEEPAAVKKFTSIIEGQSRRIYSLANVSSKGKKIIFRWGNHDAAILWPAVQHLLRNVLDPPKPEQLEFQQKPYIFDRICVDHGHQYEMLNHFDENRIFIERTTKYGVKKIQNLPFGSFFVLGFLNRIKLTRTYINQVQPLRVYIRLSMVMEPFFFWMKGFSVAWFFIKMRFITHPMRFTKMRKTFHLILEALHRPSLETVSESLLTGPNRNQLPFDTLIMGHNHQAMIRIFPGGKQYINTGTWIPITSLDMTTLGRHILRTYALIEYDDAGKAQASLKIWNGQPHVNDDFA